MKSEMKFVKIVMRPFSLIVSAAIKILFKVDQDECQPLNPGTLPLVIGGVPVLRTMPNCLR